MKNKKKVSWVKAVENKKRIAWHAIVNFLTSKGIEDGDFANRIFNNDQTVLEEIENEEDAINLYCMMQEFHLWLNEQDALI